MHLVYPDDDAGVPDDARSRPRWRRCSQLDPGGEGSIEERAGRALTKLGRELAAEGGR